VAESDPCPDGGGVLASGRIRRGEMAVGGS
jgi:hypothetical protein